MNINCTAIFANITAVGNNAGAFGGAVFISDRGVLWFVGKKYLINNSAQIFGGAIVAALSSQISFSGANYIDRNNALVPGGGGGLFLSISNITVNGIFVL